MYTLQPKDGEKPWGHLSHWGGGRHSQKKPLFPRCVPRIPLLSHLPSLSLLLTQIRFQIRSAPRATNRASPSARKEAAPDDHSRYLGNCSFFPALRKRVHTFALQASSLSLNSIR